MKAAMKTRAIRSTFCVVVLLGLRMLVPEFATASVTTYTFSTINNGTGTEISELSIDTTTMTVSFETTDGTLTAQLDELRADGTLLPAIFIGEFQTIGGVSTLLQTDEFDRDLISSVQIVGAGGALPVADVTFAYTTMETLPPSVTPEPASMLLFGTGLLGALGVARRKLWC
jgi:hypothetical protein